MKEILKQLQKIDIEELRAFIVELQTCVLQEKNLGKRYKQYKELRNYTKILNSLENLEITTRGF